MNETTQKQSDKELEIQRKLQETNEELKALLEAEKQHTAIIGSLSSIFFAMYYIDLEANSFQEVISLDSMHHVYGKKGDARQSLRKMSEMLASEEYRAVMDTFTDFDTIDFRLGKKKIIIQEYVDKMGDWIRCSLISVERDKDGKNRKVLCGLRQITAEKETLERQDSLILALSTSYENVYTIEGDTGEAICYRMGQEMSDRYGQKFAIGNYEYNIGLYIEQDVLEEDRHLFDEIRSVSGVNQLLADRRNYYFNYRVFRNGHMQYFQCQIVKPRRERN